MKDRLNTGSWGEFFKEEFPSGSEIEIPKWDYARMYQVVRYWLHPLEYVWLTIDGVTKLRRL